MAALGLPALLAPGCLAARPRAVAIPMVAAAANGERPPASPAVAQVQDRSFGRGHRSLQRWGAGRTLPACARLQQSGLGLGSHLRCGPRNDAKAPAPPGFSFLYPARQSIPPPVAAPSPPPHTHPPRYARDDAASPILDVMIGFLPILMAAHSTWRCGRKSSSRCSRRSGSGRLHRAVCGAVTSARPWPTSSPTGTA